MQDYFYKFFDEQAMLDALGPLGMTYVNDEGVTQVSQGSHQYAAWVVGEIAGLDGYHLNLRQIDPEFSLAPLEQYLVQPQNPVCVWA